MCPLHIHSAINNDDLSRYIRRFIGSQKKSRPGYIFGTSCPEVIQRMTDVLEILPFQLFLEYPVDVPGALPGEKVMVIQELTQMRQKFVKDIDGIIEKYGQS
ncbi:hypothetical protein FACS1894163_12980 [Spirochaetia bacterium]|nr:hypothetical protein FACS1894163_12980 [Spirochaetia bacterium]